MTNNFYLAVNGIVSAFSTNSITNVYFSEIMEYLDINESKFHQICDSFRSPHIWKKEKDNWVLRSAVWMKDGEK